MMAKLIIIITFSVLFTIPNDAMADVENGNQDFDNIIDENNKSWGKHGASAKSWLRDRGLRDWVFDQNKKRYRSCQRTCLEGKHDNGFQG